MNNKGFKLVLETIFYFSVILIAGVIYAHFNNAETSNEPVKKEKQALKVSYPNCYKFDMDECNKETFTLNPQEKRSIVVKVENNNDSQGTYTLLFKHFTNDSDSVVYSLKDESGNTFISQNNLPSGVYDNFEVLNAKINRDTSIEYEIEFESLGLANIDLEVGIREE